MYLLWQIHSGPHSNTCGSWHPHFCLQLPGPLETGEDTWARLTAESHGHTETLACLQQDTFSPSTWPFMHRTSCSICSLCTSQSPLVSHCTLPEAPFMCWQSCSISEFIPRHVLWLLFQTFHCTKEGNHWPPAVCVSQCLLDNKMFPHCMLFSPDIPGRYLSHPTECQLGICQGNSEEHQVFLAHHDMVESWLMDLLKFMNLKSLEAVCEGEETISFDQGLAHRRSCTNLSYQRCGRRQLISKAAQIEGVFMLFRHLQHCYGD